MKRTNSDMRPATDTVSMRVKPRLIGRCCIVLSFFVILCNCPAWAQDEEPVKKQIVFKTNPPDAKVSKRSGEGEDHYVGLSGSKLFVTVTPKEQRSKVTFHFTVPLPFGRYWESPEKATLTGKEFLRASTFPPNGTFDLNAPLWVRFLAAVKRRPLTALFLMSLPFLILPLGKRAISHLKAASSQNDSSTETTYGDYTILGMLGKGAMGVVYMGESQAGVRVALKSILPEYAQDPEFAHRFEHEIRACVSLNHPNLLKYFGHGIDSEGVPFSVTEMLQGTTLKETLESGIEHPQRLASDVLEQIGSALDYLHSEGLIHRDVKPDNIFVCDDGNLKLMDLGLVKGEAMTVLTRTGLVLGTPAYMSPEQLNGQPDPASDQYSLGILLYEILAGRRPFVEPDMMALMLKHNMTPPPSMREFEPRVPEEIDNVILKMLSKKPAERFGSIQEVQDAISDKLLYLPWPNTVDFSTPQEPKKVRSELDSESWISRQIGEYKVESILGQGGMATVFKGADVRSDRTVAVKIIQNKLAQEEEFRKRFHREVKVSENLKHPNIVELLDSGEHEDHLYLVLEFVDGEDLSSQITEGGHPLKDMIGLLESILDGLSYAHGLGVVHRDLKPQNIMLTSNRVPKIADFGLARSEELAKLTKTGQAVGTPAYFPPEQVTGAPPTPAADQYSLGIVFYELLCGVRPFNKKNPMELLFQHLSEEPVNPTQHRKDLPPLAAEIILRMLAKNPEARLENLAVVKEGLRAAVNGENWSLPLQPVAIETSVPSVSVAPIASGQNDETINFGVTSQDG